MRKRTKWGLWLGVIGILVGATYITLQPGPPLPGDDRWCAAIKAKPIEEWTLDEAQGYAELNCMRFKEKKTSP